MYKLLNMTKERIANGTDKPCITGNVLKDPDAKLNEGTSDSVRDFHSISYALC